MCLGARSLPSGSVLVLVTLRNHVDTLACKGSHVNIIGVYESLDSSNNVFNKTINHAGRAGFSYNDSKDLNLFLILRQWVVGNDPAFDTHES